MKKRTWHYAYHPFEYDIQCPSDSGHDITWSEWEKHIWCRVCKEDIKIENSILNGPIPMKLASMLNIKFDRIIIATGEIDSYDTGSSMYHSEIKRIKGYPQLKGLAKEYPDV